MIITTKLLTNETRIYNLRRHLVQRPTKNTVAFDLAKEMEKGQIIEAYEIGESEWTEIAYENGNDYYNQTYNK